MIRLYNIRDCLTICAGNQRKNEMSSRPVEPTEENVYQERSVNSPSQYAEAEDTLAKEQS